MNYMEETYDEKNSNIEFLNRQLKFLRQKSDELTIKIRGLEATKEEYKNSVTFTYIMTAVIFGILIFSEIVMSKLNVELGVLAAVLSIFLIVITIVSGFLLLVFVITAIYRSIRYYVTYKVAGRAYRVTDRSTNKGRMLIYYNNELRINNQKIEEIMTQIRLIEAGVEDIKI